MAYTRIFLLGSTGYLGSEFLISLGRRYPSFPVKVLLRDTSPSLEVRLRSLHPNVTVVEGTVDSVDLIVTQVLQADIIITIASSDHWPSVKGPQQSFPPRHSLNLMG